MFSPTDTIVRFQSRDKSSGNSSNYYATTHTIKGTWQLMSVLMPNTAYNVRAGINDTVTLTVGATTDTVTLVAGYYTATTLAAEAATRINAGSISSITCAYSTLTGKISLTHASNITVTTAPALGWDTVTATAATTVTADNVLVLRTTDVYNVEIDQSEGQNRLGTGAWPRPYAFMVEVNENSGEFIHYESSSSELKQLIHFPNDMSTLHVTLRDDAGNAISLNGADWSFCLRRV